MTRSSAKVFHSWHPGHRPSHFGPDTAGLTDELGLGFGHELRGQKISNWRHFNRSERERSKQKPHPL